MRHVHQEVPGRLREGRPPGPGEVINQQSEGTAGHRVPPCPGHTNNTTRSKGLLTFAGSLSGGRVLANLRRRIWVRSLAWSGHRQLRLPPTAPSQEGGGGAHRSKDTSRHEAVVIPVLQDLRVKVSDQLVRSQPLLEVSLRQRH